MKKQTKKHILEFLHFWPMTIVVPILLLLILFPGLAGAKEKYLSPEYSFYPDQDIKCCLLYTSPSPRDQRGSRMPSSA